jgi:hypothetical protein
MEVRASDRVQQISFHPLRQFDVSIPILTSLPEQRPTQRVSNLCVSFRVWQVSGLPEFGQQKSLYLPDASHAPLPYILEDSVVPSGQPS